MKIVYCLTKIVSQLLQQHAKLYVPVVTLSIEDNAKLTKLLSEGLKRFVYWNKYNIIPYKTYNQNDYIR